MKPTEEQYKTQLASECRFALKETVSWAASAAPNGYKNTTDMRIKRLHMVIDYLTDDQLIKALSGK